MNDPRLLTLLTLIKVKSYTKTAERLFITQPAVSQHVKSLEHQYDITIFDGTKGFNLTKQGEILVEYARRMQNQDLQLKSTLYNSINQSKPIKIGISDYCKEIVSDNLLFNELFEQYSSLIELQILNSDDIFLKLQNGEIDLALVDNSYNEDLFEGVLVDILNVVPYVSEEGKFKEIKRVTREMLKNNPIILPGNSDGLRNSTIEGLRKSNINLSKNTFHYSNSPYLMTELIKSVDGIGFMYNNSQEFYKGIKKMDLTNFKCQQSIYMIYSLTSFEKKNYKKILSNYKKA